MQYKTRLGGGIVVRMNVLAKRLEAQGLAEEALELKDLMQAVNEYRRVDGEFLVHSLNRDLQAASLLLRDGQVEEAAELMWNAALSIYTFGQEGHEDDGQ